jgi:GH15 family glucan-1,4-alpha-glucosidase
VNAPTGAVAAAPTTSLPEVVGAGRNWDYRFSWVRDSQFTIRSLLELGCTAEADGFRRFIERSAAGSAESLQIMYGLGGERRLDELVLELEGYRKSSPVRIGNAACHQRQHDVYGYLLDLAWRWHERGHSPDDDYWRFLLSLVDRAAGEWSHPDQGIWELRGEPRHFVHSKVMCWAALDRGLRLARECQREAPVRRWTAARNAVRQAVETRGYDPDQGIFVSAFGGRDVDAALLLLPAFDFVAWDDERMVRTTNALADRLDDRGLLRRYRNDDGLDGDQGAFIACTFWLVECLAHQGRLADAHAAFDRAAATANDLGLFSEEFDTDTGQGLGNFPQGLTHLSHIAAVVALADAAAERSRPAEHPCRR